MILRKITSTILLLFVLCCPMMAQDRTTEVKPTFESLFNLPPFERAICCIKFYEGLHRKKDLPYVGYGHKLKEGENYSCNMSASEAECLLRKDLRKLCDFFKNYGKDSLLLATLAYNVGPYKIIGNGRFKRSELIKKIDAGIRDFRKDYLGFCKWKGKKVPSIERRRYVELLLLYNT